ncbi:MAG TPA: FtsX-like permease family protein [Candidatus Eisenbergiella merdavium]|uniref:FtsX-like permease family protein n=1 Tax=Candidatus Eisenbergiella merdavium TaxID=2838551 RepID=A0A9D2NDA6_9FIRM|nr:FtsX-like permease family protein [Candidatus Eisenbergiella merdavium]
MTLNDVSRKLFKNNRKQYGLFFFSIVFSIAMTGAYGVLQYSPAVINVLVDGGSTQTISQAMFFGSMLGIIVFLVYADSIFLKYKSREIGIFLSLGIDRRSVQKIIVKEYTLLFQIAALLGLLLSVPLACLCWNFLNLFLETQETAFRIGYAGLAIAFLFSLLNWFILRTINRRYIKTVDILKIIQASDENEAAKKGNLFSLISGVLLIPAGIIAFFTLQNFGGFLNTLLAFTGLAGAASGVYLLIVQCASIGDILKKYNDKAYYKNIVFYNLLKQKIRQYTRSIFVATLLITFTIFGIGFIAAGFIDGYNVALNEPYDYTINATCEHPMTEKRIEEMAAKSNATITDLKYMDCLLLGVQNNYISGERDWGSRIIVSEDHFNAVSDMAISVAKGSYTVYYDSSMKYKRNAFSADSSLFYNPTTEQEFTLTQNEPICRDGLFNTRSVFSSFLILNNEDYHTIAATLANEYKAVSYMVNVENWQDTTDFQNNILQAVISDNDGVIFTNWHNSATFAKTGSQAEYLPFEGNETKIARLWSLYPLSKLSSTTTQFEAFATYLMLMLFIAIVAFVSAVMVMGLKLISTIWDDAEVYRDLRRLGMKRKAIKGLITKQMLFVYFIPTVSGCMIGAFTTYRIMLVSSVIYIAETMQSVTFVCALVLIIQIVIFFMLRSKITRDYA